MSQTDGKPLGEVAPPKRRSSPILLGVMLVVVAASIAIFLMLRPREHSGTEPGTGAPAPTAR